MRFLSMIALVSSLGISALSANESGLYTTSTWERELLLNPSQLRVAGQRNAPQGDIQVVAEYEPMEGAVVSFRNSMKDTSEFGVPVELLKEISEDDTLYVLVNSGDETAARDILTNGGATMTMVKFIETKVNSYWTRDYAPWWIRSEYGVEIIDFFYNRPARPDDNKIPGRLAKVWGVDAYYMDMIHCGGNFMGDGYGNGFSTDLVWTENSDYTMDSLDNLARKYLGVKRYHILEDPLGDYIKHIDCWGKLLAPDKILIADVPDNHENKELYNKTAKYFESIRSPFGTPYKVYRILSQGEPYTNSLILNKKVFVPIKGTNNDAVALATYREAMPGYEVIGFENSGNAWLTTDALHCRVKGVADREMLFIGHRPLVDTVEGYPFDGIPIEVDIKAHSANDLIADSLLVHYRYGKEGEQESVTLSGSGEYSAIIPFPEVGESDTVFYYLQAADESGRSENLPYVGSDDPFWFIAKAKNTALLDYQGSKGNTFTLVQSNSVLSIQGIECESVSLCKLNGALVQSVGSVSAVQGAQIDMSTLSDGVYILFIELPNGTVQKRLITTYL